jgi:hypothetical protein
MTAGIIKARTFQFLYRVTPPFLFEAVNAWTGRRNASRGQTYQGVTTDHDAAPLHVGRYSEAYDKYWSLDPNIPYNHARYRYYNVAMAAFLAKEAEGDYLCAGVAYGVAPRILYDFAQLHRLNKSLHLIDPFNAIWGSKSAATRAYYHKDPSIVARQYPAHAKVRIHRGMIPDALPLPGVSRLAFVYLDTTDPEAKPLRFRSYGRNCQQVGSSSSTTTATTMARLSRSTTRYSQSSEPLRSGFHPLKPCW